MPTTQELNGGFSLGDWEVLPAKGILRCGDQEVHPEPKVLEVLLALARRDGDLVTKDELIAEVWDGKAFSDEPILRCISLLRGHFNDKKPFTIIETLPRRGYRLLQPVVLLGKPDSPAEITAPGVRLWKSVAAVIAIGFIAIAGYMWGIMANEPEPRSIAILQIENLSGDPEIQYVVDGVKNRLAQRLAEIPNFTIKNARLNYEHELSAIAKRLKVEYLLTGDVQLQGDTLKISYLITLGATGATRGGGDVSGRLENLFSLQERLARKVREDVAGDATPQLITRGEPNSAAYNSYMRGIYALELRFEGRNLELAIELFKESISLDENYGPAYLALATAYALTHDYYGYPFEEMRELALETIEKGVAVDASIEDASWAIHGFVFQQKKEWKKSEEAFLRAINATVVDPNAFSWYSRMLASTGRLKAAKDIVLVGESLDPDNAMVNSRIAMAQTWFGDDEAAFEYFRRSDLLGATGNLHVMSNALLLWRVGRAEESKQLSLDATTFQGTSTDWIDPVYAALSDPGKRDAGLAAINRVWADQQVIPDIVLIVRTLLGDLDGAMEIAELLELEGEAFSPEMIFIPELAPLRKHPRFEPLLERLGIVAYWDDLGCTWDGDRVTCPDD
jgi:DNA-binding winged helix-turn-helix (wHTH) protein/TolB-like protein